MRGLLVVPARPEFFGRSLIRRDPAFPNEPVQQGKCPFPKLRILRIFPASKCPILNPADFAVVSDCFHGFFLTNDLKLLQSRTFGKIP